MGASVQVRPPPADDPGPLHVTHPQHAGILVTVRPEQAARVVEGRRPGRVTPRLTDHIPDWRSPRSLPASGTIGVLLGEGIGPEVVRAALSVLDALKGTDVRVDVRAGPDDHVRRHPGPALAAEVAVFCESVFADGGAMFCGAIGGRFVYELRKRFDLYCKLVPLQPSLVIADASIVRPELLSGVDMLVVRENVGGLYLGEFGRRDGGRVAYQHASYSVDEVARILLVAADLARARRGNLAVVVKRGGIPELSALWCEQAEAVAADRGVSLEILDVDNASFQIIAHPRRFDVIATSNLLGDILADGATTLLGSRGMSYSANFGPQGRAVYQTGHGAAHDLAGRDTANPVAQILSLAMMLHESFGLAAAARGIEAAVERVLAAGFRTPDIAGPASRVVGTRELAERIAAEAGRLVSGEAGC
jgi:3-isopropylmalate dehydrogenase